MFHFRVWDDCSRSLYYNDTLIQIDVPDESFILPKNLLGKITENDLPLIEYKFQLPKSTGIISRNLSYHYLYVKRTLDKLTTTVEVIAEQPYYLWEGPLSIRLIMKKLHRKLKKENNVEIIRYSEWDGNSLLKYEIINIKDTLREVYNTVNQLHCKIENEIYKEILAIADRDHFKK